MIMIWVCLKKRRFIPNWEYSKDENDDYPVHLHMQRYPIFRQTHIYIHRNLNRNIQQKATSKFIFTEEEKRSVVITLCQKYIQHMSLQMGNPTNFKETHASDRSLDILWFDFICCFRELSLGDFHTFNLRRRNASGKSWSHPIHLGKSSNI